MTKKIPEDAFAFYVSLREDRSYQAVADHYGVTKRSIVSAAEREGWMARLEAIEKDARVRVDKRLGEEVEEMSLRHRKLLRAMASRAAKAIADLPLATGMEGIRAAETVIKLERLLAGEPNDRSALTVEQTTRRELDQFLAPKLSDPNAIEDENDW